MITRRLLAMVTSVLVLVTVPVGGGAGRVFRVGKQPINASLTGFYNVETPDDFGADWQVRSNLQFLFPRGR